MKVVTADGVHSHPNADAIVIGIWKNETLAGAAAHIDRNSDGALTRLIESGEVSCERLELTQLLAFPGVPQQVVMVVGLGEKHDVPNWLAYRSAAAASRKLAARPRKQVLFSLEPEPGYAAVCGSVVGCVGQDLYRQEKKSNPIEQIVWGDGVSSADVTGGEILGQSVNLTRRLVNAPANEVFPESFAESCVAVGKEAGFETEIWDAERLEREKCGALIAVAKGSERPPRLAIMRYMSGPSDQKPLALVGKGVTFDSGGLSLKPGDSMVDMKCDMAGAATVLGAMNAIAQMRLPVNVIGFVGLVENMVSGRSYRLGDVLTARNGKTIEVLNTDAEGRLVLADTLDVAVEMGCAKIVDLATLTGACVVALGNDVVGLMANDKSWSEIVLQAAESTGEPVWQLPMFAEFGEQIKSDVADIKNVGDGRWGGAITAAKFLEEFVDGTPWVHLDIAGPSFASKPKSWIDAGASGCFVRTLVELAQRYE